MPERRWLPMLYVALLIAAQAAAAQSAPARITFDYDFPGDTPQHYRIDLAENGEGKFQAPATDSISAFELSFHMPMSAVSAWFAQARALHFFDGNFEAKRKVAATGEKTLRYDGPDGAGQATVNYTENKRMADIVANFLGIGLTLEFGQRFDADARFHRIGLDLDMVSFKNSLKNRQATYPEIIAPILQRLADNPDVMAHVQRDAVVILQRQ